MYNVCTIMYTHIRSQASDWNCCVKRLFVCTTVHIPYSTYHVKTNPSQMTTLIMSWMSFKRKNLYPISTVDSN